MIIVLFAIDRDQLSTQNKTVCSKLFFVVALIFSCSCKSARRGRVSVCKITYFERLWRTCLIHFLIQMPMLLLIV